MNYFTTAPDSEVLLFRPVDAKCLAMIGPNIIGTSNAVLRRYPEMASPAVNGENDRIGSAKSGTPNGDTLRNAK